MFERVFNRLGHGSVVEKIEEEEEEEEEETESGEGQRVVVVLLFFLLLLFFYEDKKQRDLFGEWGTLGKWGAKHLLGNHFTFKTILL